MLNRKRTHRKSMRGPYPAVITAFVMLGISVGGGFAISAMLNAIFLPEPDITIPIIDLV